MVRKPSRKSEAAAKSPKRRHGLLGRLLRWTLVAAIWGAVGLGGLLAWYAYDLPDVGRIAESTRQPSVTLLAADGTRFAWSGEVYGATVRLGDLPADLPRAVMAVEDRRFYEHMGIDPLGLLRASAVNLCAGRVVQGGSTITQQLAKILFLEPERTLKRKVQELLLALWLEQKFNKDQILALYLNRVYLGAGAYGVDAAAQRFFGKPAAQVTLYEAAMLAGLLKAPSRYNPARDADIAGRRARIALDAMVEAGFISAEQAAQAQQDTQSGRRPPGGYGHYFADWVVQQVPAFVGRIDEDLVVKTTLDGPLQAIAEEETRALLDQEGVTKGAGQAAFVALSPEGAVRALVGGRSYPDSQFNRAVQALRQPGSAFKTFVYLAAVERGARPEATMIDAPIRVAGWTPDNYSGRFYGEVTLREAFARSLNSVAVQLSEQVGPESVVAAARRLGITSDLVAAPSIALGTSEVSLLELTGAYGAFANQGNGVLPYGIVEIQTAGGRVLWRHGGDGPGRVVQPQAVNTMTHLLAATVDWGTGKAAAPGRPAAGKTGTSQDFRDAWFIGFTAELVAGAWFGNDDGTPMKGVTGGGLPAQLWRSVLTRGLNGVPARPLPGAPVAMADTKSETLPAARSAEPGPGSVSEDDELGLVGRILRSLSVSLGMESAGETAAPYYDQSGPQR